MKTKISIIIFFISFIAISGCVDPKPDVDNPKKLEKVRVAQFADVFLYMPLYLANEKGFFKEEGLDVSFTNTGGDDKTFAAIISGSATFGVADPTFVPIAKERGQNGKVIASIVNGVPFWGITKKDIEPFEDIKGLKGYSVATFPSPSTAYTLQYDMFEDAELKPNIRQAAFGTLLPLLETGDVDIALELEPNVSSAIQNNGAKILYSMADMYGDFAITGVTVTEETIKEKPELVQKFVNALEKAEKFAHTYPDSAVIYANKIFPDLDDKIVENAMNRIIKSKTFPDNTNISNESWEKAISLRHEVGDIKSLEIARTVLDMQFAEKAMNKYKNYPK